jgi:hypothetical protein
LLSHLAEEEVHRHHHLTEQEEPLRTRPQSPAFRLPITKLERVANVTSSFGTRAAAPAIEAVAARDGVEGGHPHVAVRKASLPWQMHPARRMLFSRVISIIQVVANVIPE